VCEENWSSTGRVAWLRSRSSSVSSRVCSMVDSTVSMPVSDTHVAAPGKNSLALATAQACLTKRVRRLQGHPLRLFSHRLRHSGLVRRPDGDRRMVSGYKQYRPPSLVADCRSCVCSTGFTGWAALLCGTTVERTGHDFRDTALASSSLLYPRTLVEPHTVGGVPYPLVTCGDPNVCENMCSAFREKGRPGGLPPPEACAMCKP